MTYPPGAEAIGIAARRVLDRGWLDDGSVFSENRAVWTPAHLDELQEHYVLPARQLAPAFLDSLHQQLVPVSDGARQLAAELLYLNVLPLRTQGSTKRTLISTVLSWTASPPTLPDEVDRALDGGVFNGGVGFNVNRWRQLVLLVHTLRSFKQRDPERRRQLLTNAWAFRDFVRGVPEPAEPGQRNALLFLAFPDEFPPVVGTRDRQRIVDAFRDELTEPTGDTDRDLAAVRSALSARTGSYVDFYQPPWDHRWRSPVESPPGPDDPPRGRRAWLVRGSNVGGHDLVGTWLHEGFVSLRTRPLEPVDSEVSAERLHRVVDEAYADASYNQRRQLFEDLSTFLTRMSPGDVLATTSQGQLHVGRLAGQPEWVQSPDGRSNLRRPVVWEEDEDGVDFGDLPPALAARLQSQADVLDLTEQLPYLEGLLAADDTPDVGLVLKPVDEALADRLLVGHAWLQECIDLLTDRPQLIFYGPPGTGKTYLALELARHLAEPENVALVQFHPSYSYEDFFEGLRPAVRDGSVVFELTPGPFRRLVDHARERPGTPHVLIIDEINRGNLAKIFGELYFLLEYRDHSIELLYSGGSREQGFTLPPNVVVIGTMNTADRSIALLDAAMRRRFAFVALDPAEEPTRSMLSQWLDRERLPPDTAVLLDRLNAAIDDPDFRIGPSYFMRRAVYETGGLERTWRTSILPLLAEHHFGDRHRRRDALRPATTALPRHRTRRRRTVTLVELREGAPPVDVPLSDEVGRALAGQRGRGRGARTPAW